MGQMGRIGLISPIKKPKKNFVMRVAAPDDSSSGSRNKSEKKEII